MAIKIAKPEQVLELIDDIYSSASDPLQWIPMAEKIQSSIGGHSVNFCLEDTQNPEFKNIYSNGVHLSDIELYEKKYIGRDNFTEIYENIPDSTAILTQNVWGSKTLYQCYPYEEFYKNLGYAFFNCCLFYKDEEKRGWLSVVRSENDPLFSTADLKLMQYLTPHLKRAFLINKNLYESHIAQHMCLDALEHLSAGIIFLSNKGHLIHSNTKAQKYLRNLNNMKQNFRVILPDHSANIALQRAIAETLYSNKVLLGRFIPFKENGERHIAICLPWKMNEQSYDWLNHQVGCLLFILTSSLKLVPQEELMTVFDISQSESRVLSGILDGLSTEQLSDKLCISKTTVRFHIKNLLRKFAAHNQVEMLSKANRLLNIHVE